MSKTTFSTQNGILSRLPPAALEPLIPLLEHVELPVRKQLEKTRVLSKQIYFMESGLASVVSSARHKAIEVGIIGREGFVGLWACMGAERPMQDVFIQIAGTAHAIDIDRFRRNLAENADLRNAALLYAYSFGLQMAQTALANGEGNLEERLARWLLMAHDRLDGDNVPLTHDFLSMMLAVRRSGVSIALKHLTNKAMISQTRGTVLILDRKALEMTANGFYPAPDAEK